METAVDRRSRRLVYAIEGSRRTIDEHVFIALSHLREIADDLVVIAPSAVRGDERERLQILCDVIVHPGGTAFVPDDYRQVILRREVHSRPVDEVVLTGDSWFGPILPFDEVMGRMAESPADAWQLVENTHRRQPESFPSEGFPEIAAPWVWTVLRRRALRSEALSTFWSSREQAPHDAEYGLLPELEAAGLGVEYAFRASDFPSGDPLVFSSLALLRAGCPVVGRAQFRLFPPLLDQHAVVGRETISRMAEAGYASDLVWQSLSRAVAPKALNTNAGLLDVIPDRARPGTESVENLRLIVILHISEFAGLEEVLDAMTNLPVGYDLLVTTADGMMAAHLQRHIEQREGLRFASLEVRVVPPGPGRDMSDFFVGCRDVLLTGGHDVVIKLHNRPSPRKTLNLRRYSRRYQLDNLLNSPGYARNVLAMFVREPGLGLVFPPMVHIGFGTMGRGWVGLEAATARLRSALGISIPVDAVSPLAPYGGMWIGRPEALRPMLKKRWRHADYRRGRRERELARVQERIVVLAAAEEGYHTRTVLTSEHASISHTALQFKTDQVAMSVRGYPIDQVRFLHQAGAMGHGGPVALLRMYLRLNHFGIARRLLPFYYLARRVHRGLTVLRSGVSRFASRGDQNEDR